MDWCFRQVKSPPRLSLLYCYYLFLDIYYEKYVFVFMRLLTIPYYSANLFLLLLLSVMRSSLMSGSQLATYDTWKKMMIKLTGITDTPILHVIGSVISGVVAQTVIMPVDTIKTRVMIARSTNVANTMGMTAGGTVTPGATVPITQVSPNSTPLGALKQLLKEGGVGALYKGYVPGVMRQIPTMFIQMPLIEQIRKVMGLGYL